MPPALVGKVTGLTRCVEERQLSNQETKAKHAACMAAFQSQAPDRCAGHMLWWTPTSAGGI